MARTDMVILEQDYTRFSTILQELRGEANARFVFLLDKNGQQIASAGELPGVDPTALASLTAGNVAATEGLAQLIGESEFSALLHEGKNESLHISVVSTKVILLVIFNEHSSLGLVRLRVQQLTPKLAKIVDEMLNRGSEGSEHVETAAAAAFAEITDEDIDALFG
jgi:predicted regulator of Ras-like GTPase activity (Roadblock/LC7/MglB family)